jgi:putative ABC transport system substrate-binding protein
VVRGIAGLGMAAAGLPLLGGCGRSAGSAGEAIRPEHVYRVGWLAEGDPDTASSPLTWPTTIVPTYRRFYDRLAELGYFEGRTLHWEWRRAPTEDQLAADAAELAGLQLDLILVLAAPRALRAAYEAPGTTPVVTGPFLADPIRDGYAQSLARPGGKVTGPLLQPPFDVFGPKVLEIYQDLLPTLRRLGLLVDLGRESPVTRDEFLAVMLATARSLGIACVIEEVRELDELDDAFDRMARAGVDGVWLYGRLDWTSVEMAPRIIATARRQRLPIMGPHTLWPPLGALFAYGPNIPTIFGRTADYMDKVLRGARPADLAIEYPTKYDFIINLKAARELGLTIPPSALARATEVIQ